MPPRMRAVARRTPKIPNLPSSARRSAALSVVAVGILGESVGRHQETLPVGPLEPGEFAEGGVLFLAQRPGAFGDEARDGDHREHERREVSVALVAPGDLARRQQRVDAAGADLVRPREHPHGGDGLRGAGRRVSECFEEFHVRRMQVPHQVDHGIGRGGRLFRSEEAGRPCGSVLGQRGDSGCVDEDHRLEPVQRPPDVDPLDVVGGNAPQVDHESPLLSAHRDAARFALTRDAG